MYSRICIQCGSRYQTKSSNAKYCSPACGRLARFQKGTRDRELTADTPFLCQLYRSRGESVRQIAKDLGRSVGSVRQALAAGLTYQEQRLIDQDVYRRVRRCAM